MSREAQSFPQSWGVGQGSLEDIDFSKLIVELYELSGHLICSLHGDPAIAYSLVMESMLI